MSDNQNPEQPGHKPESSQPQQESPIKNMFQRWHERAQSQPQRTFTDEEYAQRDGQFVEGQVESNVNTAEIVKDLAREFMAQLNNGCNETLRYMKESGSTENDVIYQEKVYKSSGLVNWFSDKDYVYYIREHKSNMGSNGGPDVELPTEKQYLTIDLMPTRATAMAIDKKKSTSPIGDVPVFFKGGDGRTYQAKNAYILYPFTGEARKMESIGDLILDSSWANEDTSGIPLDNIPYQSTNLVGDHRFVSLGANDYEQLGNILEGFKSGEIKRKVTPGVG